MECHISTYQKINWDNLENLVFSDRNPYYKYCTNFIHVVLPNYIYIYGGGALLMPPQVLASWPKHSEDNHFIIFPSFPFSKLEFQQSISMETAIPWSKYTRRDIVYDEDGCMIRKKKQDNYHPVLLCWQFSNVVFCIPVQGKAVKFDKLTSKKRESVIILAILSSFSEKTHRLTMLLIKF